jgi:hypothetical protein
MNARGPWVTITPITTKAIGAEMFNRSNRLDTRAQRTTHPAEADRHSGKDLAVRAHRVAADGTEEPSVLECGVAVHAGPDGLPGGRDVVEVPSTLIDAGVDTTEERHEGRPRGLEVCGIAKPELGQSRSEHDRIQVGFSQREAAVVPEVGHPVGHGIIGDCTTVQLASELDEPAAHHLSGQLVHPAEVGVDDHRRRA